MSSRASLFEARRSVLRGCQQGHGRVARLVCEKWVDTPTGLALACRRGLRPSNTGDGEAAH